jgi:hypothetical protein
VGCEPLSTGDPVLPLVPKIPRFREQSPGLRTDKLSRMRVTKRLGCVLAAGVVLLVAAGDALAESYVYRFTSADQLAARRTVLLRRDLPGLSKWDGGSVKPGEGPTAATTSCSGAVPKQPVLVVTGDKETRWTFNGFTIDTQTTVFRSAAMVEKDWARQPQTTQLLKCFHDQWAAMGPAGSRLVSAKKLSISTHGTHSMAIQIVFSGSQSSGKQRSLVAMDIVNFTRGRTRVTIAAAAPLLASSNVALIKTISSRVADILEYKLCGCIA